MSIFSPLTEADFLEKHWQRSHLLVEGAFKELAQEVDIEDILTEASADDVESELLIRPEGAEWELTLGPFDPEQITALDEAYVLSVRNLEAFLPELVGLWEPLKVIPGWQKEATELSYSHFETPRGPFLNESDSFFVNLGPACDFEIAAMGEKPSLRPYHPVEVLADFQGQAQLELGTGDLLYLPAGYGFQHEGTLLARLECKAPLRSDMFKGWLHFQDSDPRLSPTARTEAGARITESDAAQVRQLMEKVMEGKDFHRWLGCQLTSTSMSLLQPPDEALTEEDFAELLADYEEFYPTKQARWAYSEMEGSHLFVNGESFVVESAVAKLLAEEDVLAVSSFSGQKELLCQLFNRGYINFPEDLEEDEAT